MTDNLLQEITKAAEKLEALRAEQREIAKKLFNESFKKIFETYPLVESVQWTQYTPYFNDGDECTFGVHDWGIKAVEDVGEECRYGEHSESFHTYPFEEHGDNVHKTLYQRPGPNKELTTWNHKGDLPSVDNPNYDPKYGEPFEAIKALQNSMDEDVMKELFGNHVEVIVTKDGIQVEDYDHE